MTTNAMAMTRSDSDVRGIEPNSSMPSPQEWGTIFKMAESLVPTGFLPKAVDTPAKAAAIMLKGRELGIPPMTALSSMAVINGKVTIMAELMMALVKRAYGRDVIWVEGSTDKVAKIGYRAAGAIRFYEFTIEMAHQAQLVKGNVWQSYPAAMLRARCVSAVCRMEFPEVIGGMYVPGELGEDVDVNDAGEVITVTVSQPPQSEAKSIAQNAAPPPTLDRETISRRVHAEGMRHGIDHDDLHRHAVHLGFKSWSDMPADKMDGIGRYMYDKPEEAKAFYAKLREQAAASQDPAVNETVTEDGEIVPAEVGRGAFQSELIDLPADKPRHPNHGDS